MTEKDFRKIVTDLELTKEDKEELSLMVDHLGDVLRNSCRNFRFDKLEKAGAYASGTLYHGAKIVDLLLICDEVGINNFPLMNQAVINEVWNAVLFGYNLEKTNQISFDNVQNSICFDAGKYNFNIIIRFKETLNYQTDYYVEQDLKRIEFINLAGSDFNLYKNTLQLIKEIKNSNGINLITNYMIELLLYYGLCENFTTHTYAAYLKEFVHSIDDLLKGVKIDQDDDTYRRLGIERVNIPKKNYMIIDVANPSVNLTNNVGEAFLSELKKLKKLILKQIEQ